FGTGPRPCGTIGCRMALGECCERQLGLALAAVEVAGAGGKRTLEPALDGRAGLSQVVAAAVDLAGHEIAAFLREPALLLAELVQGVRPLARERALELEPALLRLLVDQGRKTSAGLATDRLDVVQTSKRVREGEEAGLGDRRGGEATGGENERRRVRE